MQELRQKQYEMEEQFDSEAAAKRLNELREKSEAGDLSLPRSAHMVATATAAVQRELEDYCSTPTRGVGGKYKAWLRALPSDLAALMAVRSAIQITLSASSPDVTVQRLASHLGKQWELEVRIREAQAVNPMYMQRVSDQMRERGTVAEHHIRKVMGFAYQQVMKGEIDNRLTPSEYLHIGKAGVDACIRAGLLKQERRKGPKGIMVAISLDEDVRDFLTTYTDNDVRKVYDRETTAMVCPPDPWEGIHGGGYLTPRRKAQNSLVTWGWHTRPRWKKHLRDNMTPETAPVVFSVANHLQSTAFEVHKPTLAAMRRVYEAGGGVLGVPTRTLPPKPACPFPESWVRAEGSPEELAVFDKWRREAAQWYAKHREWAGATRVLSGFLRASSRHDGPLWFPVYADRRGRWYYRGSPNPQGCDMAKAVLHLHEKKPLGERGLYWLRVQIANSLGFDKARMDERVQWVEDRWEALERALDAPEDAPDVWGTDSPWCAYTAAWELREALRSGNPAEYRSGAIVHQDATCSGLQHFSALLRDEVGAAYVNLTDDGGTGPKRDIYAKVAEVAQEAMLADLRSEEPQDPDMARWWLDFQISRSLAKKPVMTYVYGATLRGTARYIEEQLILDPETPEPPAGRKLHELALYAARKLFTGIACTVPAAAAAMQWLRGVTSQLSGKPLHWVSPSGFLVVQDYAAVDERVVRINSCNLKLVILQEPTEGIDQRRMANAVSPNFVHSLDAAHLSMTVERMRLAGKNLVAIHDSFGTHACDVDTMRGFVREEFVKMYHDTNLLGDFLWEVGGLGTTPPRGSLDVRKALDSEFMFC